MGVAVILTCAAGPVSISPRATVARQLFFCRLAGEATTAKGVITATCLTLRGSRSWTSGSVRSCKAGLKGSKSCYEAWQDLNWRSWSFSSAERGLKRLPAEGHGSHGKG